LADWAAWAGWESLAMDSSLRSRLAKFHTLTLEEWASNDGAVKYYECSSLQAFSIKLNCPNRPTGLGWLGKLSYRAKFEGLLC
jgi:hypothetical protein